jgi:hypothetical protein
VQKEQPSADTEDVLDGWREPAQHQDREDRDGTIAQQGSEAGWEGAPPTGGQHAGQQERLERSRLDRRAERQGASEKHVPEQL